MKKLLSISTAILLMAASCSKVPSDVIQPEEMAQLMADVHVGESVIDMNYKDYSTDSLKQVFKQSVYLRHGVDTEKVDSSLAWYGRNMERYMDVYDRTIEILEHRLIESGNRVAAEAAMSIAGDSVDVWPYARYIAVDDRTPSKTVVFDASRDGNWERGDIYVWRAKMINNGHNSSAQLVAEYADGSIDFISKAFNGEGWSDLTLYTDSTLDATRIYGYINGDNPARSTLRLDSIELVRKRLDPDAYSSRYNTRRIDKLLKPVDIDTLTTSVPADSTAVQ